MSLINCPSFSLATTAGFSRVLTWLVWFQLYFVFELPDFEEQYEPALQLTLLCRHQGLAELKQNDGRFYFRSHQHNLYLFDDKIGFVLLFLLFLL